MVIPTYWASLKSIVEDKSTESFRQTFVLVREGLLKWRCVEG